MHLLLHNIFLLTLLTNLWPTLPSIKVSVKYTCFSCNSLTCFFEIFLNSITGIECFLVVLIKNFCLKSFVCLQYLVQIAIITEIQDVLQEVWYYVSYLPSRPNIFLPVFRIKLVYLLQLFLFLQNLKKHWR